MRTKLKVIGHMNTLRDQLYCPSILELLAYNTLSTERYVITLSCMVTQLRIC